MISMIDTTVTAAESSLLLFESDIVLPTPVL